MTNQSFHLDTSISLPGVYYSAVAWADYNEDGKLDFLLTGCTRESTATTIGSSISKLYKNTGSGFLEDTNISLPGVGYSSVGWADYTGDGKPDFLLTGSTGSDYISKLYKNTGSGFLEDTSINLPGVFNGSVGWADYTGDGNPDFLLTGYSYSNNTWGPISKLYKNTGNGFQEDLSINLPGVNDSAVAWADYNGDGKPDFLLTGYPGTGVSSITKLYKNTGSGFVEDTNISLPGVYYSAVAWADYNGDGKPDFLLTGSTGSSRITKLYKNTGSGFLEDYLPATAGATDIGVNDGSVAWADYNGDGKPDFLLTGSTVLGYRSKVYKNTGSSFVEDTNINLPGVRYSSVAWADYSGDDKPDFLLTGSTGSDKFLTGGVGFGQLITTIYSTSQLYLNTTTPFFNNAPTVNNDSQMTGNNISVTLNVLANDSDADGSITGVDLDINTAGVQSQNIVADQGIFSIDNSGVLSFTPINNFTGTASVAYQAIDNLGATSNIANVSIGVVNNSNPVANSDTSNTFVGNAFTLNILANDSDVDGNIIGVDLDINTAGVQSQNIVAGQGIFSLNNSGVLSFTPDSNFTGTVSLEYQAIDNIGATSNIANVSIGVQEESLPVSFIEDTTVITLPRVFHSSLAWADYSGDGKQDFLLTGDTGSGYISKLYKNTGSGFVEDTSVNLPGVRYGSVAWADYNGDGKRDFLLTGDTYLSDGMLHNISKLYKNTGSGFVEDTKISLPGVYVSSVAWADYSGDGKQDFLLTGVTSSGPISKLYKNTGSSFVEDTNISLPGVFWSSVAWTDYSGDGKPDFLLTGSTDSSSISKLYKNTGSSFVEDTSVNLPGVRYGSVAWVDYSGDGKPDFLLTGSTDSSSISKLYKNTGSSFLEDTSVNLPGVNLGSVAWADYSGDGKQDFLLTGSTGSGYISKPYKNIGSGFVEDTNISLPGVNLGSVAWADYSGDGKQDFLLTGSTGLDEALSVGIDGIYTNKSYSISKLYLNTTTTPFSNNTPTVNNDSQMTGINTSVTLNILANDSDADGSITGVDLDLNTAGVQSENIVANQGTFSLDNSGVLSFTPDSNFTGTASLEYQAIDNIGATSNIANVSIGVVNNSNPVANSDTSNTFVGNAFTLNILANDSDVDGNIIGVDLDINTAGVQLQNIVAGQGIFSLNNSGVLSFTPDSNFTGTASLEYQAIDNIGATSNIANVGIQVNSNPVINSNPVANNDTAITSAGNTVSLNILANDTDDSNITGIDLDINTVGVQSQNIVAGQGTFNVNNGVLSFTPVDNFTGTASVAYQAIDNMGATSNIANVSIKTSFLATPGADLIIGTANRDVIDGLAGNDTILGLGGGDKLTGSNGDDSIDGGQSDDTMIGGTGNDIYHANSVKDKVLETLNAGTDKIYTTATYTLPTNVENLYLQGKTAINGTGNTLNNIITGNSANNIINGGKGNDTMIGSTGNDTYYTNSVKDKVLETLNAGTDKIYTTATYTLPTNVENLYLQGKTAINGTGNSLPNQILGNSSVNKINGEAGNDIITGLGGADSLTGGTGSDNLNGGAGNDTLIGNAGNDRMTGSTGADRFVYNTDATFVTSSVGVDTIIDFTKSQLDKIVLDKTTFTKISSIVGNGFSVISEFASLTSKFDTSGADIVYDRATGKLFYNQNGNIAGYGTGGNFMTLTNKPALSASDFIIQA